jgi:hypothetical protein
MSRYPTPEERDERVAIPLDPETALEALMAAGPHPPDDTDEPDEHEKSDSNESSKD